MPTLDESVHSNMRHYTPADIPMFPPATRDLQPVFNPVIRCPLPLLSQSTPDALRQFYVGGGVPQFRLLSPSTSVYSTIKKATTTTTTVTAGGKTTTTVVTVN